MTSEGNENFFRRRRRGLLARCPTLPANFWLATRNNASRGERTYPREFS